MSCHYCKCNKYSDTFYLSATNENGVIISCKVTLIKSRQEFIVESLCFYSYKCWKGRGFGCGKLGKKLKAVEEKSFKILISFTQSRNKFHNVEQRQTINGHFWGWFINEILFYRKKYPFFLYAGLFHWEIVGWWKVSCDKSHIKAFYK